MKNVEGDFRFYAKAPTN